MNLLFKHKCFHYNAPQRFVTYLCFCCIQFLMSGTGPFPNAFGPAVEVGSRCCVGGEEWFALNMPVRRNSGVERHSSGP